MRIGILVTISIISLYNAEYAQDDSANAIEITQVSASSRPIMKNDSLMYFLDLIFKEFPAKFWSYTDSANHLATIEIFGHEVRAPVINLPSSCPVHRIQFKSHATKMALSGLLSTITVAYEPTWNVEIGQLDSNDIRLVLGKKMDVIEIKEELIKKKR